MNEIKLGDTVQCKYTGLKGVAMCKTEFINGCVQYSVSPKWNPKSLNPIESSEMQVDSQSLKLIKKGARWNDDDDDDDDSTGGPMRVAPRMRGY